MYKNIVKVAGILQDVLYKSVVSGNIVADPGTANQVLLAYSKDTGELIGSTVWDAVTKTYKMYLSEPIDEKIFLTRIDNGGVYFAETYDRVSTGVGTFTHGEEYDDLQDASSININFVGTKPGLFSFPFNIIHENLCKVEGVFSFPSNLQQGVVLSNGIYNPLGSKINGVLYSDKETIICDASKSQYFTITELIHSYNTDPFNDDSLIAAYPMVLDARDCLANHPAAADKEWRYSRGGYDTYFDAVRIDPFEIPLVINRSTTTTIYFEFVYGSTSNTDHLVLLTIPDLIQLTLYNQLIYFYYLNPGMVSGTSYTAAVSTRISVALVIAPSGSDKLYINGVLVATKAIVTPLRTNDSYFSLPGIRNSSTHNVVYHGAMVFNRELTLAEIQTLPSIGRQNSIAVPDALHCVKDDAGIALSGGVVPDYDSAFLLNGSIGNLKGYSSWYVTHYGITENKSDIQFNGSTGVLYRTNTKNTSNMDVSITFSPTAVTLQCIWKIGDATQGLSIGINASAKLTLYARNAGTLTSISTAASLVAGTWYTATLSNGLLTLFDAAGTEIESVANTLTIGTYTGQESIGAAYNGSPIAGTTGNSGYFNGKISNLVIADKDTLGTKVVNSENTLSVWYGDEELPVEVVKWDMENNNAVLWTKSPEVLSTGTTLDIKQIKPTKSGLSGSLAAQDVWNDSFLAVYHMNPDSILLDSTKNRFHGTLVNIDSTNFSSDLTGSKMTFNGIDEYTYIPFSVTADLQRLSISSIFRPTSIVENDPLFDIALNSESDSGVQVAVKFNALSQLDAQFVDNDNTSIGVLNSAAISTVVDSFVALSYNGKTNADSLTMSVDGTLVDSETPSGKRLSNSSALLYIGKDAYSSNYYDGSISELFICDKPNSEDFEKILRLGTADQLGTYTVIENATDYVLWTPAEIVSELWLDADDSASVVLTDGKVSAWNDKSGNTRHAVQGTASNRPIYTNSVVNGISFDGVNTFLTTSMSSDISQEFTVFLVFERDISLSRDQFIFNCSEYYASTVNRFPMSVKFTFALNSITGALDAGGDWNSDTSISVNSIDDLCIISFNNKPGVDSNIYQNGILGSTGAAVALSSPGINYALGRASLEYGGGIGLSAYKGLISEIIFISEYLIDEERQKIEGYLAHKWGLAAVLPSTHPYKNEAPISIGQSTTDPYWNETVLCMPMNGLNNSTMFQDLKNKAVTTYGNSKLSSDAIKFGLTSARFDGSGDYLTIPDSTDWDFGTSDFTIELWANFSLHTTVMAFVGNYNTSIGWYFQRRSDTGVLQFGNANTSLINAPWEPSDNTWYHLAVSRNADGLRLFVNGVQLGATAPNSTNITGSTVPLVVGALSSTLQFFNGYITDLRITKGVARYISDFELPTKSIEEYSPIYNIIKNDPYWYNTVLAMPMNNTDSVPFEDLKGKTATVVGGATVSTAQSKFGGASGYFDGTGDYLSFVSSPDFDFGTDNFTIELFIYVTAANVTRTILSRYTTWSSVAEFYIEVSSTNYVRVQMGNSVPVLLVSTSTISVNKWYHIAITRNANVFGLFIDGVLNSSFSSSIALSSTSPLGIGYKLSGNTAYFNGYMDDLRITKGVSRYTSEFTPPTRSYFDNTTSNTTLVEDPNWAQTTLLMNMNGADNSTSFIDEKGSVVTPYGNAKISVALSKFGGASGYFDGTGDYLSIAGSTPLGSGDFTIECWVYSGSVSYSYGTIYHLGAGIAALYRYGSTFIWYQGGAQCTSGTIAANTWYHVAIVRSAGVISLYVNGEASASTFSTAANFTTTTHRIGCDFSGNDGWFGYIDDVRVMVGVALYIENFTPPIKELSRYIEVETPTTSGIELQFDIGSGFVSGQIVDVPIMLNLSASSGISNTDVASIFTDIKTANSKVLGLNSINSEFGFSRSGIAAFSSPYLTPEKDKTGLDATAFKFTGNVNSIINITNCISRGILVGTITFSMWIKLETLQASSTELLLFGTTGISEFQLTHRSNGELIYRHTSTGFAIGNVRKDKWSHIVIVRDGVNKTLKIYINGVIKYTFTYTTIPAVSTNNIFIGGTTSAASGCSLADIRLYSKALLIDEIDALYNSYSSYFKGVSTSILTQNIPVILGEDLTSVVATDVGNVYYALSQDLKTYYIKTTVWKPIVSIDPLIHGFIGETEPYYWDDDSNEWVFSRMPLDETISKAVQYIGNRMDKTQLNSITDFTGIYNSSIGLINLSVSLESDGLIASKFSEAIINNKQYWISDLYKLDDYVAAVSSSSIDVFIPMPSEGVDYKSSTKVYSLISGESAWTECVDGTIPNLTVGFVTAGKTIRFKVVWDKTVWGSTPKDISVELKIK